MEERKKISEIHYTLTYLKSYQKLPRNIQEIQDKKEGLFKENPFNPALKTHKLKGKHKECYSYSV